jgi:hypothetical protein
MFRREGQTHVFVFCFTFFNCWSSRLCKVATLFILAIHSYKSNPCCTKLRITRTIIFSENLPPDQLMVNKIAHWDPALLPIPTYEANRTNCWTSYPKEPHSHRYSILCKSQVSFLETFWYKLPRHLSHKISHPTEILISPKAGDSRWTSCLLAKSASFAYLKRAQTRLTGDDSVFAIRAALLDIILRVGVTDFGYLDRR